MAAAPSTVDTALATAPDLATALAPRHHLDGCPAGRIERITTETPHGVVQLVRCVDCGGFTTTKET